LYIVNVPPVAEGLVIEKVAPVKVILLLASAVTVNV
jgi:hypothetical protein